MYRPVVLAVLDGWGISQSKLGNAIAEANLPTIAKLDQLYPHITLQASGISVGLPWGEEGNSEVGHITLGAGKIIYQNLPRITMAIQNESFFQNPALLKATEHAQKNSSALHLMGLVGKGAVHSHIDHLYALLNLAKKQGVQKLFLHIFTDGRDSSPTSGAGVIRELQEKLKEIGLGKIATLGGRNFGMDRNNNWDRIAKAYNAIAKGEGLKITDPIKYLEECYKKEQSDEYIEPAVIIEVSSPVAVVQENDAVIFFNFREDRAREITKAFVLPDFKDFPREPIKNLCFVTFTQYEEGLPVEVAFAPEKVKKCLGSVLAENNLKQLRISETEKFAHVTYFFNGGNEDPFPGEDRIIVPSVTTDTFDKVPEMSAAKITDKVIDSLKNKDYAFILINYANADMVGHTGNEKATIKAIEALDNNLTRLIPEVLLKGGCLLVTSDHGNAEEVLNSLTGEINTQHSTNPVPLWLITPENHGKRNLNPDAEPKGLLSDIAPTILELLNLPKPPEMTGESLLDFLK
ncbi:MAG: 2,3-bisphosphoglycerate-independent phosphoglycerate mutase [Candidatus Moranbacteria bacterium]|nr:2,3-bisphosphoglycerate-independent phosphoglycerate mutase [Candidatus Moranbacteria bacterium]